MKPLLLLPVLLLGGALAVGLLFVIGAGPAPEVPELPPAVIDRSKPLPDAAAMEKLAAANPVDFLENCIRRYELEVKGYSATLCKQERIGGTLYPPEVLEVRFREQPFSVWLHWLKGERRAKKALYVAGANDNKIIVLPAGFAGKLLFGKTIRLDVNSPTARASGRYTLDQFGIQKGTLRTLAGWQAAQKRGTLHVQYLGQKKVDAVGGRVCYCLHRTYARPDPNGANDLTLYIDKATWLQLGSIIKDRDGKLIGEYYFKDIQLNPEFGPKQFDPEAVSS